MSEVLYRKYRPTDFESVRGQERVVEALKQAMAGGAVAHAYLFTGSRGTGKTSIARIFARALGCEPVDIFEIDAASHTSVEDIRDLNDAVSTLPLSSKYKVYILDEVHMLSKAAFNAFLKTLEEPPAHIIFILATTEENKVPDTVRSRCHTCIFQRPSTEVLTETVREVAELEGYALEEQSARLIALIGDGSFRDALTLLQSVLTVSKAKSIKTEEVERILGASPSTLVFDFVRALCEGDVKKGKAALDEVVARSFDIDLFSRRVVYCIRNALLARQGAGKPDEGAEDITKHTGLSLDLLKETLDAVLQPAYIQELPLEMLLVSRAENK